jgi:hypothetical protein
VLVVGERIACLLGQEPGVIDSTEVLTESLFFIQPTPIRDIGQRKHRR